MFSSISENKGRIGGIKIKDPINSNKTNFIFGLPEWQQKYTTTTQEFFTPKNIKGNRLILDKENTRWTRKPTKGRAAIGDCS